EATLFAEWQEQEKAVFYFDADRYYFDDPLQEAGMFLRRNILQYGLRNALGEFSGTLGARDDRLAIVAASGKVAQAKLLSKQLKQEQADGSPTRTAIILADERLLIPVLQSLPDDTAFNVTMGY